MCFDSPTTPSEALGILLDDQRNVFEVNLIILIFTHLSRTCLLLGYGSFSLE